MPIRFRCSHCQQTLSISRRRAGSVVQCPACNHEVRVPDQGDDATQAEEAERGRNESAVDQTTARDSRQSAQRSEPVSPSPDVESPQTAGSADEEPGTAATSPPHPPGGQPAQAASDEEGGVSLRAPRTEFEEMDLTPMVDVTFLLLIFFMITASFSLQKTLEVPRPDPEEKGATQSIQMEDVLEDSVKVEIDDKNRIYIDEEPEPITDPTALVDTLRDRTGFSSEYGRRNELLLIADPRAFHETVVMVVDAAHEVGMQRIRLASSSQ